MAVKLKSKSVKITDVFCDKFSATIPLYGYGEEKYVFQKLDEYANGDLGHHMNAGQYKIGVGLLCSFSDPSRRFFMQAIHKKGDSYNQVRLECNPAKDDMGVIREYVEDIIPDGWGRLLNDSSVTRVDCTLDMSGSDITDFIFDCGQKQQSTIYTNKGSITGLVFGSGDSKHRLKIYDKAKEQKYKSPEKLLRLETVSRDLDMSLSGMVDMSNPFKALKVYDYKFIATDSVTKLAVCVARNLGLKMARQNMQDIDYQKLAVSLKAHQCEWWNSELIWQGWPQEANKLINPPEASCFLEL